MADIQIIDALQSFDGGFKMHVALSPQNQFMDIFPLFKREGWIFVTELCNRTGKSYVVIAIFQVQGDFINRGQDVRALQGFGSVDA